jgi:ubiquinone/menaquinone biosynthesis C-methylase UbiE
MKELEMSAKLSSESAVRDIKRNTWRGIRDNFLNWVINTRSNSDKAWERLGALEPYWAVQGLEELRHENLNKDAITKFLRSGQSHIELVLHHIHTYLDHTFKPRSALDFGCGVGRTLVPLASICDRVVGVDISEAMLQEARRLCNKRGISNVEFVKSDNQLSRVTGTFDLIHSDIVFQHVPRKRGEVIFRRLIDLLQEGGIGALHFTYFRKASWFRKTVNWGRRSLPLVNNIVNLVQGKPVGLPLQQMNCYNLNLLFRILQEKQCAHSFVSNLTPSKGFYRMILYIQKKQFND